MLIRLGHSPDADDAFMFYALSEGLVETGPYRFEHVLRDIQTLNVLALQGVLEVSAISIAAYPAVQHRYALLNMGASMGDGYGPVVVASEPLEPDDLRDRLIAVPGKMTTAFLTLNLFLGKDSFRYVEVPFDQIADVVRQGRAAAGVLIHEGQITFADLGLHKVIDLGQWWRRRTGLPLPLGGNVIRRDLPAEVARDLAGLIRQSIRYAMEHRDEAMAYASRFARGLSAEVLGRFVDMYVNRWTLDYGEQGKAAVRRLLQEASQAGLVPPIEQVEFVDRD